MLWNSAAYLRRCLSGLATQIYRDIEVVLIDNGSTDESTMDLVEDYPNINRRVERFETDHGFAGAKTTLVLAWRVENG